MDSPHVDGRTDVKHKEMPESMLQILEGHTASDVHFLRTRDELWMFCEYPHEIMWPVSREEIDELEQSMHYHRKTMETVFFNGIESTS
jgi:hypothetical protein